MIITNKNKIGVTAEFDSGTFQGFSVVSLKNPDSYCTTDINIQSVENLTFEDFTALEIMIGDAVSKFLDMKQREREIVERENENWVAEEMALIEEMEY